tara:strand:+ start:1636 stop:2346 length:711 start_codon:yes stop_codon:yes gene_type:complete
MIRIQNLNKSFGALDVLKDVNLEIMPGTTTGVVGPNGSGKTTLIKCLLGLVRPDSGSMFIDGVAVSKNDEYRKEIGYMPQVGRYPENMKVYELIRLIEDIRDNKENKSKELIEYFGLETHLEAKLRNLSGGTRQKVSAVLTLMYNPKLLIFDEPTAGLDPQASIRFKNLVKDEKNAGKTILLTTHITSEIEELADNIIFIVEGKVHYHGPLKNLLISKNTERLEGAVAQLMEEAAA